MSARKVSLVPSELKRLYENGVNISQYLRKEKGLDENSPEIIEIAYDLQAGSYIDDLKNPSVNDHKNSYGLEIAKTILGLCSPESILEAGVGEATTFAAVLSNLDRGVRSFGFDISWSRIAHARRWLARSVPHDATLCTGDLICSPFADDSVDVVYTSHSIEPNGGNEHAILAELYRIAGRYLFLLEPGYELASDAARKWMENHGYCRNLAGAAASLGMKVLRHELFPVSSNPLNPTALTVIEKRSVPVVPSHTIACPRYKTPLEPVGGALFSRMALTVYPVVGGIACLRLQNAVLASQYEELAEPK